MARILIVAACLWGGGVSLFSRAQNNPAPQLSKQPAQPEQNRKNPFEPIPPAPPQALGPNVIEGVDFRGAHRITQHMLRSVIFSKVGDPYNEGTVRRDVMILRNTKRFDDVRVSTEEGKSGGVVLSFVVTERPPIH